MARLLELESSRRAFFDAETSRALSSTGRESLWQPQAATLRPCFDPRTTGARTSIFPHLPMLVPGHTSRDELGLCDIMSSSENHAVPLGFLASWKEEAQSRGKSYVPRLPSSQAPTVLPQTHARAGRSISIHLLPTPRPSNHSSLFSNIAYLTCTPDCEKCGVSDLLQRPCPKVSNSPSRLPSHTTSATLRAPPLCSVP